MYRYLTIHYSTILCLFLLIYVDKVFADYGVIFARLESSKSAWHDHYCINYNPKFSVLPADQSNAVGYSLVDFSEDLGCFWSTKYNQVKVQGCVVAVARGNCTFTEKAQMALEHGAAGILIVSDLMVFPGANQTSDYDVINITVAGIERNSYQLIMGKGRNNTEVLMVAPSLRNSFDPCMVIIFSIAILCITIGGYWSGIYRQQQFEKKLRSKMNKRSVQSSSTEEDKGDDDNEEDDSINVTIPVVTVFFVLVCTFLILLYFFYDQLVYVVIVMFCLAGAMGLYYCVHPIWRKIPWNNRFPKTRVPFLSDRPPYRDIVLAVICLTVGVVWGVERNKSYAWIIQDILGTAFCINMLKTIQMPNLKICMFLLVLLFLYDIFFVFVTPLFTPSGESVMVKVATGESSSSGEQLPMVFKVPRLTSSSLSVCDLPYSLLGFGDIIVPGLLVSYNHGFDVRVQSRRIYFIATVIAYAVGLVLTFIALYVMESGQPALLYLVPCTLITTLLIGCARGELKKLWGGYSSQCPKKDDDANIPDTIPSPNPDTASISSRSSDESESKNLLHK